jgi:N-acetylmuramic acid 6-phosphate etherase
VLARVEGETQTTSLEAFQADVSNKRLGILDASEIPPTFSAPGDQFVGIIAGGEAAIRHAQEGAEDDVEAAVQDLDSLHLDGSVDSLIGIAASGRTPYVLSCLSHAKSLGCATIGVACTEPSAMGTSGHVDFMLSPVVGSEVVTGSTRMKAGTATKLVLNMLSTGTMIKTGKTYGNMVRRMFRSGTAETNSEVEMVDLKATNLKLRQRSRNILRTVCGDRCPKSDTDLDAVLEDCHGSVKLAIVALSLGLSPPEAIKRLDAAGGILANVVREHSTTTLTNSDRGQRYVLCIDGGGSKCAAGITSPDGHRSYGEGPSCNVTDVGIETAISSISSAIQKACDGHPGLQSSQWQPGLFASVWVGLAGHDRPNIAIAMDKALEQLFGRPLGPTLRVTNDIDLLVIPAMEQHGLEHAIVLVAGTGSVAMCYQGEGDQFKRIGRAGGWGHLLGDDGSGFDIGRQAIRHCLTVFDQENNLGRDSTTSAESILQRAIVDHFRPPDNKSQPFDLLSAVLTSSNDLEKKRRIAQVAQTVVEISSTDPQAAKIVDTAVAALVQLLEPFVNSRNVNPENSMLILGGGLMQSKTFSDKISATISNKGMAFAQIKVAEKPAQAGAEHLLRKQQR